MAAIVERGGQLSLSRGLLVVPRLHALQASLHHSTCVMYGQQSCPCRIGRHNTSLYRVCDGNTGLHGVGGALLLEARYGEEVEMCESAALLKLR